MTEWGTFTAFNPRPCLWKHSVEKQRGWLLTISRHAIRPLAPKNRATSSYRAEKRDSHDRPRLKFHFLHLMVLYKSRQISPLEYNIYIFYSLRRLFELSNQRDVCTPLVPLTYLIIFVRSCRKLGQGSRFILTAVPTALTGWSASAGNRPRASSAFASWSPLLKPWVC